MNRREALIGATIGSQLLWHHTGDPLMSQAETAQRAQAAGPRPWDIAIPPKLSLSEAEILPGAAFVRLKLSLDRDPFMTVRVLLRVEQGHAVGFRPADFRTDLPYLALWSPGDDLVQYLTIPIRNASSQVGWRFRVTAPRTLRQSGWARAERGTHVDVKVVDQLRHPGIPPTQMPRQRPLHRLRKGLPSFDQDMERFEWSRTGLKPDGTPVWRSSLQYGDGPANANEKGLYATAETYPGSNPHLKGRDRLGRPYVRLHTRRFDRPVRELDLAGRPMARSLPFQAAWLSGQTLPGLCHSTGLWEFEFVSPDRHGAWAAHWMMGVRNGRTVWPPEIDVFEHFNGVYGPWDSRRETSAALHYGDFGRSRAGTRGTVVNLPQAGFDAATDLTSAPHLSQCLVTDDFITIFMDGLEIVQFRHILKPIAPGDTPDFHPVINVAVAPSRENDPYDQGSGDMLVYGYRYFPPSAVALEPTSVLPA